jgi:protein O-mannosyl-transferase
MTSAVAPKAIRFFVWFRTTLVSAILVLATAAAYWEVRAFGFTNFDDPDYVAQNPTVQEGLSGEGIRWAFMTGFMGNWHPITWLSHMLDCEVFGVNAGAHHVVNVAIHCLNVVLLFWVLFRYTGALERSAFVAALFALHPLHVESVAWIAERKDVLSTLFWLLTMWAYLRYTERRSVWRYLAVLFWFALGLMSKPMVVTLPFVLLLLDYWPLQRATNRVEWRRAVAEKVPLFVLVAASCVVTFIVQKHGGAVGSMEKFSIATRIGTALVAYVAYVGKMLLPENLAAFYPHPGAWPVWQVAGAAVLLFIVSSIALALTRRAPYLVLGWLWFLGTLLPVIGLVQVGDQAYADRYTYVPLTGLFIAMVWGLADLSKRFAWPAFAMRGAGLAGLLVCGLLTTAQVDHWQNSETLFRHALSATKDNYVAHYNLAQTLSVNGRIPEATHHYEETLALKPGHPGAHNNLGLTHAFAGRWAVATNHYAQALKSNPDNTGVHFNYGVAELNLGNATNAVGHLRQVIAANPTHAAAHHQSAKALLRLEKPDEAITHYSETIRLRPDDPEPYSELAELLATHSDPTIRKGPEALKLARRACELAGSPRPNFIAALAAAHAGVGDYEKAVQLAREAEMLARSVGDRAAGEVYAARVASYESRAAVKR